MRRAEVAGWATAVFASASAAGCGSTPASQATTGAFGIPTGSAASSSGTVAGSKFDTAFAVSPATVAALQATLAQQVKARMPAGTDVAASCPEVPKPGASVTCTVTIAGTPVDWQVTGRPDATVSAAPAVGLLRLDDARQAVLAKFAPDYQNATVDCGPGVVSVVKVDDELSCTITSGDRRGAAHVVVTDKFGAFVVTP
jgi:hypothetical protein